MTPASCFFRKFAMAGLWVSLCCGCALHTRQTPAPDMRLPNAYTQPPAPAQMPAAPGRWWKAFNDAQLDRLMVQAFAGNLDLDQAVARLRQLDAVARRTGAGRRPRIDATGNVARARQLGVAGADIGNTYELSVAAGYEVDLWNKINAQTLAAGLERDASLEEIRTLYLTLSAQVADLYYLMAEQRAQIRLADHTVAARKAALDLTEQRYREGIVPALDVYQARQSLAAARARKPEFQAALAVASHALAVLVGDPSAAPERVAMAELPDLSVAFPLGLPSQLLTRRPDIREAFFRLTAADHKIGAAVAERFPSINLLAGFGRAGMDFGTGLSETVWQLIGDLALPLFDAGSRKAEVDRTRAVFDEQLGRYRQTVLGAFQEVEDALAGHRSCAAAIEALRAQQAAAESALHLASDRYMDGLSDFLPVLAARALHLDARSRLLSTRRKWISERISLARALGGNWMEPEIKTLLGNHAPMGEKT